MANLKDDLAVNLIGDESMIKFSESLVPGADVILSGNKTTANGVQAVYDITRDCGRSVRL